MVCHWDDVEREAIDRGELRGERLRLGSAAGTVRTGLSRYLLPAGARAMPVHPTTGLRPAGVRAIFRIERVDCWDGEA